MQKALQHGRRCFPALRAVIIGCCPYRLLFSQARKALVSGQLLLVSNIPLDTPEDVFASTTICGPPKSPRGENGG
jgi:hypothetical protein